MKVFTNDLIFIYYDYSLKIDSIFFNFLYIIYFYHFTHKKELKVSSIEIKWFVFFDLKVLIFKNFSNVLYSLYIVSNLYHSRLSFLWWMIFSSHHKKMYKTRRQ